MAERVKGPGEAITVPCSVCEIDVSWQGRGRKPKYCGSCRQKARAARQRRDGTSAISDLPQAELLALIRPGAVMPTEPIEIDRDGPCVTAMKRLFDSIVTEHPAAEVLLEVSLALAIDVDDANHGPTQRSNSAREMRGLIADLVSFRPEVKEDEREDPFGLIGVSA